MAKQDSFFWYELMTSDPKAAEAFYATVVGWRPQAWDGPVPYTVMNAGETGIAGVMAIPDEVRNAGGRPGWFGYVKVADADRAAAEAKAAGGAVLREPEDIPQVGRFAVLADPQGAVFMVMRPGGPEMPAPAPMTPGHVGWHELYTADHAAAFAFYARLFGWQKQDALDMGPMGTYQLFADSREKDCGATGGMMNLPPNVPKPVWGFYFVVAGIDAAMARVTAAGGQVVHGPTEVPGGAWIVNAVDPQGAHFSLVGMRR